MVHLRLSGRGYCPEQRFACCWESEQDTREAMSENWRVVYVEDEERFRKQVKEYLEGTRFPHGALSVHAVGTFHDAQALLAERKVDLLILDVFDAPMSRHDAAGLDVLSAWRKS